MKTKRYLSALAAGVFAIGVCATASFAGPMVLSPITVPVVPKAVASVPSVHSVPIKNQLLNNYRQLRAFWLSRAIVR